MNEKYNKVLEDILTLISGIQYADSDKEMIKAQLYYFLYKACETEEEMKQNCLTLDRYKITNKK